MKPLPSCAEDLDKLRPRFDAWLLANGSAIYQPTNEYELMRFLTDKGIGIIYQNASGKISSHANGSCEALRAFLDQTPWRAKPKKQRSKGAAKRTRDMAALFARDGAGCSYCPKLLTNETATIEHYVPITAGGGNHLSNKGLACQPCNTAVGHMSVRQKIDFAILNRRQS